MVGRGDAGVPINCHVGRMAVGEQLMACARAHILDPETLAAERLAAPE